MKQHGKYIVGVYCRLSRDDESYTESESITNQKRMLTKYVEEKGWEIYNCYIDDGISGTTFDRPAFQKMIQDINDGKINLVITKDLSRLGRDYIITGHYIEIYFPERNVRYIAVNDGIDTLASDNDIAPFKNILNEMYAKDISRKVRAAFKTKVENGEFIGAFTTYGYKKDAENKNKLIIDEPAAKVVKRIFEMFVDDGFGINKIARVLNNEGISNPTSYRTQNGSTYVNNLKLDKTSYWTYSTVKKILGNQTHIGKLVQGKQRTISFKCKKKIDNDVNDWIVIENSHQPIIDFELFERAQAVLKTRKREMKCGEPHMFAGLLKCEDCGRYMALNKHHTGYLYFICGSNKMYGPSQCSTHHLKYDHLCNVILNDIKSHAELAEFDEDAIVEKLASTDKVNRARAISGIRSEYSTSYSRLGEIDTIFKRLYEDKIKGTLSEKRFNQLSMEFEGEYSSLQTKLSELQQILNKNEEESKDINYWVNTIKKYTNIESLNKGIVNELIDKILVGERKKLDKAICQDISIVYKFVGSIS